MGLRITFLTILLALLWSTGPYFYKGHKGCRECHIPHYVTEASCVDCHRGDPRTNRTRIAHYRLIQGIYACFTLPGSPDVKNGHQLIGTSGCRRCHRSGGKGNGLASDLDASFEKTLPETLADTIKNPGIFMPDFYLKDEDVSHLVNAILESSVVYGPASEEDVRVIHFEENVKDNDNIFNNRCGACHRMLTQLFGGLGQGDIGPNLSGIFSPFYFKNYKNGSLWNSDSLKQWLNNPRDIRISTQMPPIILTQDELKHLTKIITY